MVEQLQLKWVQAGVGWVLVSMQRGYLGRIAEVEVGINQSIGKLYSEGSLAGLLGCWGLKVGYEFCQVLGCSVQGLPRPDHCSLSGHELGSFMCNGYPGRIAEGGVGGSLCVLGLSTLKALW